MLGQMEGGNKLRRDCCGFSLARPSLRSLAFFVGHQPDKFAGFGKYGVNGASDVFSNPVFAVAANATIFASTEVKPAGLFPKRKPPLWVVFRGRPIPIQHQCYETLPRDRLASLFPFVHLRRCLV